MDNKEISVLHLRTFDIIQRNESPIAFSNQIVDNDNGMIMCNGGYITWKNVNIKAVLGDLYNKYNYFCIKLIQINSSEQNTYTTNSIFDATIYISGLPFISAQRYNTKLSINNQSVIGQCSYYFLGTTKALLYNLQGNTVSCFSKPTKDLIDITIEWKLSVSGGGTVINGIPEKRSTLLSHTTYLFNIYGVDD
jgi:hypothetical protein